MANMAGELEDEHSELTLSDDERHILELHDRLQQLQVEIALLSARKSYMPNPKNEQDLEAAQRNVIDARARYNLRNDVANSVMSANPVLQAVHNGTNASPVEMDLLPILQSRDDLSSTIATQSTELRSLLDTTTRTEADMLRLRRQNADLAARLFELTDEETRRRQQSLTDDNNDRNPQVVALEDKLRESRRRWRVIKDVASALVVGSGVDWAQDSVLRGVVMDDETGDED